MRTSSTPVAAMPVALTAAGAKGGHATQPSMRQTLRAGKNTGINGRYCAGKLRLRDQQTAKGHHAILWMICTTVRNSARQPSGRSTESPRAPLIIGSRLTVFRFSELLIAAQASHCPTLTSGRPNTALNWGRPILGSGPVITARGEFALTVKYAARKYSISLTGAEEHAARHAKMR